MSTSPFLHDAQRAYADALDKGIDGVEALRAYFRRERPHLLASYELESLVGMVLASRAASLEALAPIEAYVI
jgi:hypothetical protein